MAQYCAVAPLQILSAMARRDVLPRSQLLLAHDIVKPEHKDGYRLLFDGKYFLEQNKTNYGLYPYSRELVILDNSVVELGKPVEFDMIREATSIVKPDCIVLPDAYLDTDQTIANCQEAIGPWNQGLKEFYDYRGVPFMYLPQGKTKADFLRAAEAFATHPQIAWWGVPRNIVEYHGSRRWAIEMLHAMNPKRQIHMFGFSDDLVDDAICAQIPYVRSIDSAVPMRCAYNRLVFNLSVKMPPRGDWWEKGEYSVNMGVDYDRAVSLFNGYGYR
jgi:hypothetical protein